MANYDNTYSRIVAWLKVLLPLLALAILSTVFLISERLDPESALPYAEGDVEEVLREQRIGRPDFAGVADDGARIRLSAEAARPQDGDTKRLRADGVSGRLETPGGGWLDLRSGGGLFDDPDRIATLDGGVRVETSTGYVAETDTMQARLDSALAEAPGEVRAEGPPGTLTAGGMRVERGSTGAGDYHVVFNDGVHLVYTPPSR